MKTVFDACQPRESIIQGTFNPEIFTAALGPVISYYHRQSDTAIDTIYTDAEAFFRDATYPTDGLRTTLRSVFSRIAGDASVPSIYRLETAFGGGKTHTLIACTHIAYRGTELADVTRDILAPELLPVPGTVGVVGIAGDELPVQRTHGDQLVPYTLWGDMAYQIGGEELYHAVQDDAESFAAPGRNFFERVLGDKKLILMFDELAQYAARLEVALPQQGAKQLEAFLMSLNGYARSHTGITVIVTLASTENAFGTQTAALAKKLNEIEGADRIDAETAAAITERTSHDLSSVVNRDASVVTPVESSEIAAVLAQRLFSSIDRAAAEEAVRAYAGLYARNAALLPEEANTPAYQERLAKMYPFHPTLIDFLNIKLAKAPNFQGTRGVLRVLALAIRALWQKRPPIQLIHVSDIDLRTPSIVSEILGRTQSQDLKAVLTTDIGSIDTKDLTGGCSQAQRADQKNPHPDGIPMYENTWKAVFLTSLVGRAQGKESKIFGANQQELILEVSTPLLTPPQVQTALDEIPVSAFFLRAENGRYYADTVPTLNSVLAQIRQNVNRAEIARKLKSVASGIAGQSGPFDVLYDICRPQGIPDKGDRPALAVISIDAGELQPMDYFTSAGAQARVQQNRVLLLVPKTVRIVAGDAETSLLDGLPGPQAKHLQHVTDLARQVIAYTKLDANPEQYGIQRKNLQDPDYVGRRSERNLALQATVVGLYTTVLYPMGSDIRQRELRAADDSAGLVGQILDALRSDGKLLAPGEHGYRATDFQSMAQQFFFNEGNDKAKTMELLQKLRSYRSWPILLEKRALGKFLREGVASGAWDLYRMGDDPAAAVPAELYTQEQPVPMTVDVLKDGYAIVTIAGAKQRHWLDTDRVSDDKVRAVLQSTLDASGAATYGDLVAEVKGQYANADDDQIQDCVRSLASTSTYAGYVGDTNQQERPTTMISSFEAGLHQFTEDDVIITHAEQSERGWLGGADEHDIFPAHVTSEERAQKIFPALKKISSLYTRGKSRSDIPYLELTDLRLPSGATLRVTMENLTPLDLQKLDEFFGALTSCARVSEQTQGDIEIDQPADDDPLVQELKK